MKKAYYFYATEDCKKESPKLIEQISSIGTADCAVLLIGSNPDIVRLKQEVNYVTDKNYHLFCLICGKHEFDSGLKLQLGLAKMYDNSSESVEKLINDVRNFKEIKPFNKKLLLVIAGIFVLAVAVVCFVNSFTSQPEEVEIVEETGLGENDNLIDLDALWLTAFRNAGLDANNDGSISKEEIESASSLNLSGLGISNLEPLLYAVNLTELDLSNNKISDITQLAALAKLEKINLEGNPIDDYSVLDYLPNLKEIEK